MYNERITNTFTQDFRIMTTFQDYSDNFGNCFVCEGTESECQCTLEEISEFFDGDDCYDDGDYDDSMDGDWDSGMASAGWGTDEDYGCYADDEGY